MCASLRVRANARARFCMWAREGWGGLPHSSPILPCCFDWAGAWSSRSTLLPCRLMRACPWSSRSTLRSCCPVRAQSWSSRPTLRPFSREGRGGWSDLCIMHFLNLRKCLRVCILSPSRLLAVNRLSEKDGKVDLFGQHQAVLKKKDCKVAPLDHPLECIRASACGSAALPVDVMLRWLARWQQPLTRACLYCGYTG